MSRSLILLYSFRCRFILVLLMNLFTLQSLIAQEKQTVKVKTFDGKLHSLKNIEVSLNNGEFISVGKKGVAIVELGNADLPIKSVKVKDDNFEAASWNLSKGVLEIIVRPKSYRVAHFVLRSSEGDSIPFASVTFKGLNSQSITTNQKGEFDLTLSLNEKVTADQFTIPNLPVKNVSLSDNQNVIIVERPKVVESVQEKKPTIAAIKKEYFDLTRLDTIRSLEHFYAIFKNVSIANLNEDTRIKIDAKFNQLIAQMDSLSKRSTFKSNISDTSNIKQDIRSLADQATLEGNAIQSSRAEFDAAIEIITDKLDKGVSNLSKEEWNGLLSDLDLLDKALTQNESRFNQNQAHFHEIINTLKERYFDIKNLETRLSASEKERQDQQRTYRQRLIIIIVILAVFGALIILLISFSNRLRKQANELKTANEEVKTINENLEGIVVQRTSLLEESNKELDTFLYRASHDLRSPIRTILGLCNISDKIPDAEYVSMVQSTTLGMDRMLKRLISISEIGLESSNLAIIPLASTIMEIKNKHAEMIVASGIQFHVECPTNITLQTSAALLEVILVNLIENGIFFSTIKNPEHARVEIKAVVSGLNVELSVYDNGVGIADSIRPKLYQMFFVGNEKSKGSGLGLYIVYKCLEALRGIITVESEVGRYSKFTIILPRMRG
jgi:signal transduction histidine kinase